MNSIQAQRDLEAALITTFDAELVASFPASGGASDSAPAEPENVPAPPDKPLELWK